MKVAAANALANLAQEEVPEYLNELYGKKLEFGREYIIPKPFDKRLVVEVSSAVAQAAIDTGSSNLTNFNINDYKEELKKTAINVEKKNATKYVPYMNYRGNPNGTYNVIVNPGNYRLTVSGPAIETVSKEVTADA